MKVRLLALCAVLTLAVSAGVTARAAYYSPRQYYSSWFHQPKQTYYYRDYYYKPAEDYAGYKHNYCIYYPDHPDYCYYYNPYKKVFWGRCPMHCDGKPQYSLLAEEDRKGSISDIPEKAFPPMADMPSVPESNDKVKMDLPPDDLPSDNVPVPAP